MNWGNVGTVDTAWVIIELGAISVGLAVLARLASQLGLSAIPLYLLAGLAFGKGGILPLDFSESFVHTGSEIGIVLLLFMLGLGYTGEELRANLRTGLPAGMIDLVLNFVPGLITGLLLGWSSLASLLLGGVTYISSSGVIAKLLAELGWLNNRETPSVLSILVLEDMGMAIFLPLATVLLLGQRLAVGLVSVLLALFTVGIVLIVAVRYGQVISRLVSHQSDEILLLTILGLALLVAGIAQQLHVSAAIGAFLAGIAISEPVAGRAYKLLSPVRDLFAATFFFFFGLEIDPTALPPVLLPAIGLGILTALTKIATGWFATRRTGLDTMSRLRAGVTLVARGEFSIVISGLGVRAGLEHLGALSATYVLFLAILSPLLAQALDPLLAIHSARRRL